MTLAENGLDDSEPRAKKYCVNPTLCFIEESYFHNWVKTS